jgi:hypothetical protein
LSRERKMALVAQCNSAGRATTEYGSFPTPLPDEWPVDTEMNLENKSRAQTNHKDQVLFQECESQVGDSSCVMLN